MTGLVSELQESPEQPVILHSRADFLCTACPHRRGAGCVSGEKVAAYDAAVLFQTGARLLGKRFPSWSKSGSYRLASFRKFAADVSGMPSVNHLRYK